jgi:hypothetical protein
VIVGAAMTWPRGQRACREIGIQTWRGCMAIRQHLIDQKSTRGGAGIESKLVPLAQPCPASESLRPRLARDQEERPSRSALMYVCCVATFLLLSSNNSFSVILSVEVFCRDSQPNAAADNPFLFAASPHGTAAVSPGASATPVGGRRQGQSVSDMNAAFAASSPFSFDPLSPSTSIAPIASPPSASYFDPLASDANPFGNTSQPSLQASSVAHRASAFDFSGSGSTHSSAPLPPATKSKSAAAGANPFASFGESPKSAPSRHDDFGDDFEFAPQALPARDSQTPKSSVVSLPSPKAAAAAAAAEAASTSSNKESRRRSSSFREKSASRCSIVAHSSFHLVIPPSGSCVVALLFNSL